MQVVCHTDLTGWSNLYHIHSNSSALGVSKDMKLVKNDELKILPQIHVFFIQKSSISPIFMCQELYNEGGECLLGHERLFEWILYLPVGTTYLSHIALDIHLHFMDPCMKPEFRVGALKPDTQHVMWRLVQTANSHTSHGMNWGHYDHHGAHHQKYHTTVHMRMRCSTISFYIAHNFGHIGILGIWARTT